MPSALGLWRRHRHRITGQDTQVRTGMMIMVMRRVGVIIMVVEIKSIIIRSQPH